MNKNKYFSPGRFARLFRNDLLINQKAYLFALAGLGIAIYAFSYFVMMANRHGFNQPSDYLPIILIFLMAIGIIVGTSFPALNNQVRTSNYLLVPGSVFEKYLVQFIIRIVILIPLALCLFWVGTHLAKASMVPDPRINFDPSSIPDFHFGDLFKEVPTFRDKFIIVVSIFSVATVLFAGSAYFNRFALVKTLIVSAIIVFTVVCWFVLFSHIFYPDETRGFDIELKTYKITKDIYNSQLAAYLLGGLSWIFFLILGYFKLKEKEV